MISVKVTNSVVGGQTGMNTGLALTQDRSYTATDSSSHFQAFPSRDKYIQ